MRMDFVQTAHPDRFVAVGLDQLSDELVGGVGGLFGGHEPNSRRHSNRATWYDSRPEFREVRL